MSPASTHTRAVGANATLPMGPRYWQQEWQNPEGKGNFETHGQPCRSKDTRAYGRKGTTNPKT
eukprot:8611873-Pyramimonas_sp.AAC.1